MSEASTVRSGIVYVAAVPPVTLSPDLVGKVALLLGKPIYDMRLLLAGEVPRIIARHPDGASAEALARSLRDAGLEAFTCMDSELRNHPARFTAHTARPGAKGVIFLDRIGGEVRAETGEAFLIIRGRFRSSAREQIKTTKIKLNVPATLLAGGIPIMHRVSRTTEGETLRADDFVRIYGGKSSDPLIEMLQNHIDYAFLGPALTQSTPVNFRLVVAKLREWFPRASYDERLMKPVKTDVPVAGPEEALEINCKLISLYHLAYKFQE